MPSSRQRRIDYSQNFLRSRELAADLVERSGINNADTVIEIGPGKGILTDALAGRSRHVLAIEKDPRHADYLRQRFGVRSNVTVFACDFLAFPLPETACKVFANIPFRLTSAIVAKLTTGMAPPDDAWLVVQHEAAERFAGRPRQTMVSVCLQPWFEVGVTHRFRRRDFVPQPSVDSVLLRLGTRPEPDLAWDRRARFVQLVEAVFSAWQPTVSQAMRSLLPARVGADLVPRLGHGYDVKPTALAPADWIALFELLSSTQDDQAWRAVEAASAALKRQQQRLDRPTRTRRGHRR